LAKQRGAYRGRKKALVGDQVLELRRRASAGEQKSTLAREFAHQSGDSVSIFEGGANPLTRFSVPLHLQPQVRREIKAWEAVE